MAFNPFAGFAKYRRFWMGTTMILVLFTFVLCTGSRGGFDELLLKWFRWGGETVFTIDGKTYYRQDFDKLVLQRKVANDYMRTHARITIDAINDKLRGLPEKGDENQQQARAALGEIRKVLTDVSRNPKFFGTGTKPQEIIDFRTWLAEADRLGIHFTREMLEREINAELYKIPVANAGLRDLLYRIDQTVLAEVARNHGHDRITPAFIEKALENEYRVRVAKLADAEFQAASLDNRIYKRIDPTPWLKSELVRTPMAPAQLWDFYQKNRKEYSVALMPIPVASFVEEVGEADPKKLEDLFEKYKKTAADPASDEPGFRSPHQIRVQYASVDVNAPYFRKVAEASLFFTAFPIGSFTPQMPITTGLRLGSGPSVISGIFDLVYNNRPPFTAFGVSRRLYDGSTLLSTDVAESMEVYLANQDPKAVALLIGDTALSDVRLGALPAYFAYAATKYPDEIKAGLQIEAKGRAPEYAAVVAGGAIPSGLAAGARMWTLAYYARPLPLPVVEKAMSRIFRSQALASKYATANIAQFKKMMEDSVVTGKAAQVERLIDRYGPRKAGEPLTEGEFRDLGLEIGKTEKFYNRYNIHTAPELKPLLEAYQRYYTLVNQTEGRDVKPETVLKDDEFWKLFFDGSESFSVAGGKYQAKPWPPIVKLGSATQMELLKGQKLEMSPKTLEEMFRAAGSREPTKDAPFSLFNISDRPFVFWRTEEEQSKVPTDLASVKDKVVAAWKMQQARDQKVIPYAKQLGEKLLSGKPGNYAGLLKQYAPKYGENLLTLDRVSPLARDEVETGGPVGRVLYKKYELPRNLIPYAKDGTSDSILALHDFTKLPIVTGDAELDKLNADLFKLSSKQYDEAKAAMDAIEDELRQAKDVLKQAEDRNRSADAIADARKEVEAIQFRFNEKKAKYDIELARMEAGDGFVQVLTNRPRDTYYIAVVEAMFGASADGFFGEGQGVLRGVTRGTDTLFDRAQERIGQAHLDSLVRQLRANHNVTVNEDALKKYENDPGS